MTDREAKMSSRKNVPLQPKPTKKPVPVETSEIRGFFQTLPDEISRVRLKEEFYKIIELIVSVSDTRNDRKARFDKIVQEGVGLCENGNKLLKLIKGRENTHIYAIAVVAWPEIYELHFKTEYPSDRPWHDHSKDTMYMFIMAAHFDLDIKHAALPGLVEQELQRHFKYEPHHPEHEQLTGNKSTEVDILEMAVDRLIRNVQFNHGKVDFAKMDKFKPVFVCGDKQANSKLYEEYVQLYHEKTEEIWRRLYVDPELKKRAQAPLRSMPNECPIMVNTDEIRDFFQSVSDSATEDNLKEELYNIVSEISDTNIPREGRQVTFDKIVREGENLSREGNTLLQLIKGREETHIYAMAAVVWPDIYQMHYNKEMPSERPWHDHSKDTMFKFILAANFDLKIDHPALPGLVTEELARHYWWEPHHPEHEEETGRECTEADILEMATDRLTRNLQFNNGILDLQRMKKFEPTFPRGNHEKKVQIYWKFVDRYKDKVQEIWQRIYGDQIHVKKRRHVSFQDDFQTQRVHQIGDEDNSEDETEETDEDDSEDETGETEEGYSEEETEETDEGDSEDETEEKGEDDSEDETEETYEGDSEEETEGTYEGDSEDETEEKGEDDSEDETEETYDDTNTTEEQTWGQWFWGIGKSCDIL